MKTTERRVIEYYEHENDGLETSEGDDLHCLRLEFRGVVEGGCSIFRSVELARS